MYTEIMFQDFYIFRIHKNVFKVGQKLGAPVCNRKILRSDNTGYIRTVYTLADEYKTLEDLVTCYGCLEWYICVCESVRFRQSRSSLQHERLFQPRQSAASQEHGAALPRRGLQTYPLSAL